MKHLLQAVYAKLTYRNEFTDPHPANGLDTTHRRGKRTVHHPDLPNLLEARRERVLRDGLDETDLALVMTDGELAALLRATAKRMGTEHRRPAAAAGDTTAECLDRLRATALEGARR